MSARWNVLGTLEIESAPARFTPSAPKICQVLGLLLLRANSIVSMDVVIEELWGDTPPQSAVTTTQTYVYHLRKAMANELGIDAERVLMTRPPGYVLRPGDGDEIDWMEFERATMIGRRMLEDGRDGEAARHLRRALASWNGPVLANVQIGDVLRGHVAHLEELRLAALDLRVQADMRLGRHRELVPELRALVAQYPLNEWFHVQLIDALNRSGRRAEALVAYQRLRGILHDELGLEPSEDAQTIQRQVLRNGSSGQLAATRPLPALET